MRIDLRWGVETGAQPNRFVASDPTNETFFGITAIPSGGGAVRHMVYYRPSRGIWFGTDAGTLGRGRVR